MLKCKKGNLASWSFGTNIIRDCVLGFSLVANRLQMLLPHPFELNKANTSSRTLGHLVDVKKFHFCQVSSDFGGTS